jgi:hydrogenase maturation protease
MQNEQFPANHRAIGATKMRHGPAGGEMSDKTLILGIGNVLWADEGFGVRCVERLAERYSFGPEVHVLDGGTQGLYLLPFLEGTRNLLVFDAVDYGLTPGTMKIVEDGEVPAFMGAKKMSLHQTGFQDVIATAQLMGTCPERLCLIGVQPEELEDYGGGLRDIVAAQIDPSVDIAIDKLCPLGRHRDRRRRRGP